MIEAQSLSNITAVAANPPLRPCNSGQYAGPLTLYIARVPGSQDVFLTTLKPREKVVTAQDVESSLYYCHVDSVEDEDVRRDLQCSTGNGTVLEEGEKTVDRGSHNLTSIQRRQLPKPTLLAPGTRPGPPPNVYPLMQSSQPTKVGGSAMARKPVGGAYGDCEARPGSPCPPSPPRLLGPRPLHAQHRPTETGMTAEAPGQENVVPRRWSEQPPALPPRLGPTPRPSCVQDGSTGRGPAAEDNATGSALTLIRRDPASGEQWNIGRISMLTGRERDMTRSAAELSLEISNPGYAKFVEDETRRIRQRRPGTSSSTDEANEGGTGSISFRRRLMLKRQDSSTPGPPTARNGRLRRSFEMGRGSSETGAVPTWSATHAASPPTDAAGSVQLPPLAFISPWNGVCEFTTGVDGRSLKCKHRATDRSPSSDQPSSRIDTVSELRFNLPNSHVFGKMGPRSKAPPPAGSSPTSRRPLIRSHRSREHYPFLPVPTASSSRFGYDNNINNEREDDIPTELLMDLALGQERAGGGHKGNKAKLGKLIVEPTGIEMLDLVVAANMGMWWNLG